MSPQAVYLVYNFVSLAWIEDPTPRAKSPSNQPAARFYEQGVLQGEEIDRRTWRSRCCVQLRGLARLEGIAFCHGDDIVIGDRDRKVATPYKEWLGDHEVGVSITEVTGQWSCRAEESQACGPRCAHHGDENHIIIRSAISRTRKLDSSINDNSSKITCTDMKTTAEEDRNNETLYGWGYNPKIHIGENEVPLVAV
uniref:Uncharacterized protein n=1 Tax=Cannabis sativa TaxID=3483 RepID=A0A803PAS5_CANSA